MPTEIVHCECVHCRQDGDHPDCVLHTRMNLLMSWLDELQRRWYAALEAKRLGRGGDRLVAQITGLDEKTIRPGRAELNASLADCPDERVRRPDLQNRHPHAVYRKVHNTLYGRASCTTMRQTRSIAPNRFLGIRAER
jgi:hypothetical protein